MVFLLWLLLLQDTSKDISLYLVYFEFLKITILLNPLIDFNLSIPWKILCISANKCNFVSSFLILVLLISFSCCIILGRTLINRNNDGGYSCLIPDLKGKVFNKSHVFVSLCVRDSLSDHGNSPLLLV